MLSIRGARGNSSHLILNGYRMLLSFFHFTTFVHEEYSTDVIMYMQQNHTSMRKSIFKNKEQAGSTITHLWSNGMQQYFGWNRLQISNIHSVSIYNHFKGTETNTCSYSLNLLMTRRVYIYILNNPLPKRKPLEYITQ